MDLGYTDREAAEERYGVVFSSSGEVDKKATESKRKALKNSATIVAIAEAASDAYSGARRVFAVSSAVAKSLKLADGDLCELLNPHGASLRGWVQLQKGAGKTTELPLGPFARSILRCSAGDKFELRALR